MSNRIGAFWVKKIKNGEHAGETMMSGVLSDLRGDFPVVAFKNRKKDKENQPDYILMTSEPKDSKKSIAQDVEGIDQTRTDKGDGVDSAPVPETAPEEDINVGDIPF